LFAVLPFFVTALGGLAAFRLQHHLHALMAFAAGVVVATALSALLPEAAELAGEAVGRITLAAAALAGYLGFSLVDALLHARTGGVGHEAHGAPIALGVTPLGLARSAGIILHSLLDGIVIGLGFGAGLEIGLLTAAAVLVHEFADGMNVVTLALSAGQDRGTARLVLALDALAPALGVIIGSRASIEPQVLALLLSASAGVFLAVGAGHLLPEAQHGEPGLAPSLVGAAAVGAVSVLALQSIIA
jgi:ZIP family zinc transporter